jgi:hypothetical protein
VSFPTFVIVVSVAAGAVSTDRALIVFSPNDVEPGLTRHGRRRGGQQECTNKGIFGHCRISLLFVEANPERFPHFASSSSKVDDQIVGQVARDACLVSAITVMR